MELALKLVSLIGIGIFVLAAGLSPLSRRQRGIALAGVALFALGAALIVFPVPAELAPIRATALWSTAPPDLVAECLAAWSDRTFVDEWRRAGNAPPENVGAFCRDAAKQVDRPAAFHTGKVLLLRDRALYDRIEKMSATELKSLGFFDVARPGAPQPPPQQGAPQPPPQQTDVPTRRGEPTPTRGEPVTNDRCTCNWVVTKDVDPATEETDRYPPPESSEATGQGKALNVGARHGMYDQWSNNCFGADGRPSGKSGKFLITSKVVCHPAGCCAPKGQTRAISDYHSGVSANTRTRWCPWSNFASALAVDAVEFYVDGTLVSGGSGSAIAASGAIALGTVKVGVGGSNAAGPTGTTTTGTGSVDVTVSQTKSDGPVADWLNRSGLLTVDRLGMVSELQSGGRTSAYVDGKGAATGDMMTFFAAEAQMGYETACGAGPMSDFVSKQGLRYKDQAYYDAFYKRYQTLRDQLSPGSGSGGTSVDPF
jgi:hypothetical protein